MYQNLLKMIQLYRGDEVKSSILDEKNFWKEMQLNDIVSIKTLNAESPKFVIYYLLGENNCSLRTVLEFRRTINKIKQPNTIEHVYFISNKQINQQVFKVIIKEYSHFNIMFLKHQTFIFELPKHVLCAKHEILTLDESFQLRNDLALVSIINLPKININDPQCVWIGAKVGDVIRITNKNGAGESIKYRIVIGSTDRKIKIMKTSERIEEKKVTLDLKRRKKVDVIKKKEKVEEKGKDKAEKRRSPVPETFSTKEKTKKKEAEEEAEKKT